MDDDDKLGAAIGSVILLIGFLIFALVDCHQRDECVESGGHVVVTGHNTIWIPVSCGKDCTTYVPEEVDEWHCEGGSQ